MSSQSESELSEFLQNFSSISLHHKKLESRYRPWVFWSEYEGSEHNSTSADVGTPINIHDKIISALSNIQLCWWWLGQFWAPVTIGGRRLLSTSAQPFAVERLSNELAKYRLNSEKYKYNIDDANKVDIEPDQMIKSGGPAIAFLNRRTSLSELDDDDDDDDDEGLNFSVMIPICLPSQSNCIGVLEFTFDHSICPLADFINDTVKEIKTAGLDVFYVQHLIPYTTINGLKLVKDEIDEALKVVCISHNLALAQVWIAYEDKDNVPLSYSLEDCQTKRLLAIKLTGYRYAVAEDGDNYFEPYFRFGDVTPRAVGEDLLLVSLQDYESRYISELRTDMIAYWDMEFSPTSAFAICLKSNSTADFSYAFEFIWTKRSDYVICLEEILLTLKRCLPRFKCASGAELGDELIVIDVETSTEDITEKFKIFQRKRSSLMPEAREEGKKTLVQEFLQNFSPISLHYKKPESSPYLWVFWSEYEGSENSSTSADVGTPIIHDKIISALSNIRFHLGLRFFGQFWAPVTIGGKRLLSTSAQPFAALPLSNQLAKYRLNSEKYKYNIDAQKPDIEPEHMIKTGGPATAFLYCRSSINKFQGFLPELDVYGKLNFSVMLPLCFPSQSSCIGVLEFTLDLSKCKLPYFMNHTIMAIKDAGLDVFYVQHLIPYKTINGLKVVKEEIEEALKVVCESHNLALAQVWIPYEDRDSVHFSCSLEDTQTKLLSALKLTGYLHAAKDGYDDFEPYFRFGDVTPRAIGEELPLVTLLDYNSRYISMLRSDMLLDWECSLFRPTSALAICLRSNDTGDFNYVFEFIWTKRSNCVIILEAILLTLKRCLPRFKFASGEEIGDELDVILVESSTDNEIGEPQMFKIFQGKRSSPTPKEPEKGKNPKVLPREDIEKQFGKTMKDAAESLNVSLSMLKRKSKNLGIPGWPGPNFRKRNISNSPIIQSNTNEEDNGAIEDTSTVNLNKNVLTIKAEYEDDIIKFHLPISQATFVHVEKEIGKKLKLSDKTYKLKYLDEDGDWITLKSDEEMSDCIKSSRKSSRIVVRMRVLPSRQPISRPAGSLGTLCF